MRWGQARGRALFDGEGGRPCDGSHREARLHARDAWESRQVLVVDSFKVSQVGNHQSQEVVVLAGHQVALHDLGDFANGGLEGFEARLTLAVQGDTDEDIDRVTGLLLVDQGGIALDQAGFLQGPHAPQTGGFGEADLLGQRGIGDPGVLLQQPEDGSIIAIQLHLRRYPSCRG